jgi:hypothetical protein
VSRRPGPWPYLELKGGHTIIIIIIIIIIITSRPVALLVVDDADEVGDIEPAACHRGRHHQRPVLPLEVLPGTTTQHTQHASGSCTDQTKWHPSPYRDLKDWPGYKHRVPGPCDMQNPAQSGTLLPP